MHKAIERVFGLCRDISGKIGDFLTQDDIKRHSFKKESEEEDLSEQDGFNEIIEDEVRKKVRETVEKIIAQSCGANEGTKHADGWIHAWRHD